MLPACRPFAADRRNGAGSALRAGPKSIKIQTPTNAQFRPIVALPICLLQMPRRAILLTGTEP